jgi:hypothetical protein
MVGDSGLHRVYGAGELLGAGGGGTGAQLLGETGIRILVRIMGLLLVALAMQFFVNGLTDLGVIAHQAP